MTPVPSLDDVLATARVVTLPLRVKFRGVTHREMVLFRGPAGWAEFGPFLEYDDAESSRWLAAGLEAAWDGFPEPLRDTVPVNATIPALGPEQVPAVLERFGAVPAVKVKVAEKGQEPEEDLARVWVVRRALDAAGLHGSTIRVDANGGWDVPTAVAQLRRLAEVGLEYAEQPVPSIEGLAEVRERLGGAVRIAADESVRKEDDPLKVARAGAADLLVVKVQPLGGVRRALAVVREAGLPAVVSSALDTSVGISAGVALAASLPQLPFACGLGTVALFAQDVLAEPLVPRDGGLPVGPVVPEEELLERHAASPERTRWWLERLSRCHAVLEGECRGG
ncbi:MULTISPECIES: o-succinylbenzoate synthase [Arthrobacter]|uniref:o-succinylbenzoate synthase n=2 Tax=Arthrobacter TaxID=1663 RepID=A0ABU9KMD5_9MICC|nr:o-succinylbenzoate synthase [Arthrobacter sp. YJM1]MDP5227508.1 o-succinylbenzoate synthase [Arthrobacter sp. YJM1]